TCGPRPPPTLGARSLMLGDGTGLCRARIERVVCHVVGGTAMPRNEKRRQAALQRHATKRKERKQLPGYASTGSPRALGRRAAGWPLYECLVPRDWQTEGEIIQILVVRRSPQGEVVAGTFLVDLGCLGVKDAFA